MPVGRGSRPGSSRTRQLVCPNGQLRLKQGEQSSASEAIDARSDSGGVKSGELDPYTAVTGTPTAHATCISPESFVTT